MKRSVPSLGETERSNNAPDWTDPDWTEPDWTEPDWTELVLAWAASHGRDLPWRHTRDPWAILVSEVMAQQTQVHRVIPKWTEFLRLWPTPHECASASLGDVLRVWSGLGYPRRAKHLHMAAQSISSAGSFPATLTGLLALPGVGPYTARAVLAFAFEQDVAVVDTNTARVLARRVNRPLNRLEVQAAADAAVPVGHGWAWNQALLDLGAAVCLRSSPRCEECPVQSSCLFGIARIARIARLECSKDPAVASASTDPLEPVDPADGTAGVSVAQSRFAGSDRQFRGAILRAAADRCALELLGSNIGLSHDLERVDRLLSALMTEGLVGVEDGVVELPNS